MTTHATHPRAAIVTGGGTGLGRGIAEVLTAAGIDCLIAGRRSEPLEQVRVALADGPGEVATLTCDVTVRDGRERLVATCLERFGRADILVNNAGGASLGKLMEYSEEQWRDGFAINVDAPFFLSQLVIPEMRSRGFGRIVTISSILGQLASAPATRGPDGDPDDPAGPPRAPAYAAAKAAAINLGRDLAATVAPWGITVNTISPGYIERPERPRPADIVERIAQQTPVRRLGEPRDIGHAVRYLVSDEASFVTGINLLVDGGWSIW